jgi:uncharacterized protein (TIGR00369 family)
MTLSGAPFPPEAAAAALAENFADWVRALDLTVEDTAPEGRATLSMPVTAAVARVGGIVSGQALMALADTAMVLAACAQAGGFRPFATTDLHCQFLRPGSGDRIAAQAEVVRAGRALLFVRAVLVARPGDKPCAAATATLYLP